MTNLQVICATVTVTLFFVVTGVSKSAETRHKEMMERIEMCSKIPADRLARIPECGASKDK